MASASSSGGRGSGARGSSSRARAAEAAPPADRHALLAPRLNPTFVAMSAADLVDHLKRSRRADDFADAALVFAARERRLADAEDFARAADEHMDELLDKIQASESKLRRAAETEAELRAKIRRLQLGAAALISSGTGTSGGGIAQQAAGHGRDREPVPQDFITVSDDDATGVQTTVAQGEVGGDVPMKMRHGAHLAAAPVPSAGALMISSGISGSGLAQQAAGCTREAMPRDFITAGDDATGVQTTVAQGGVGGDVPMKMRHGALNRPAQHLAGARAPLPSAGARMISSGISRRRGLTKQQATGCSREPVPRDFITAGDDATGVQTTVAQGEVGGDVPMKMRHGALNRPAPHLELAAAPLPRTAALMISSDISGGRGLTQQAAGCSREAVPRDFITASDDATVATGGQIQTTVAQGEVGDVAMKMRLGALNRAAPQLPVAPLPSAGALISSGISRRGLTQQAAGHGRREPVPRDFITASDDGVGFDDATGVQTMFAKVGDNIPRRPSPLRRIGAALPAASSMPDKLAEERAVERVVVDGAVRSSHQVAKV